MALVDPDCFKGLSHEDQLQQIFEALSDIASGGGSGGAPTDATFITQTPNASLTNEQALSALATGVMFVATGTGVVTSQNWLNQALLTTSNPTFDSLTLDGDLNVAGNSLFQGAVQIIAGISAAQGKPVLVLYQKHTPTGNAGGGAGENNLWNQSIAASVQAVNGDRIRLSGTASTDGSSSSVVLRVRYGGTVCLELEFAAASSIDFSVIIVRTGANAQAYGTRSQASVAPATGALVQNGTAAEAMAGAVALRVTAQDSDDIVDSLVLQHAVIEYLPAP